MKSEQTRESVKNGEAVIGIFGMSSVAPRVLPGINIPEEDHTVANAVKDKVNSWDVYHKCCRMIGDRLKQCRGPVTMVDVRLDGDEGTSFTQEIPPGDEGFVYVVSGQGDFTTNGTFVSAGQAGHLTHTSSTHGATMFSVSTNEPAKFLLWTGRPLRQPIVARGPFVMNTESQIAEAFADYSAGLFGSIPA